MQIRSSLIALLLFSILPVVSKAHGYWLDLHGTGKINDTLHIQICFGEIDDYNVRHRETGPELAYTGNFQLTIINSKGQRTPLTLQPRKDCWEAYYVPKETGTYQVIGTNSTLPVVDRSATGGINVRPMEYLCSAFQVGSTEAVTTPAQFLDIVTSQRNGLTVVKAFQNNQPAAAGTKLRVFNPGNWEKQLTLNKQGEAVFAATDKGLYIIRQDWNDNKAGTYQGVSYTTTRYRCNYCLWMW
ncbi:hypothetical protein SAMN05421788_105197 [Filimonas lacunae]|uniref:Nickel transport protein n=1 Tax=Filimonas lacunae TaxID=477680 RepID=A0A173MD24_9BACT|nr:hypothetical protein [Filimonas lacunae]BAV05348.1 hypothetical protein FLA_1355 [Filimonas lacunae]SIT21842.1 hypothetical protein SAMN05421788_105197 [Filimonas lacunae]